MLTRDPGDLWLNFSESRTIGRSHLSISNALLRHRGRNLSAVPGFSRWRMGIPQLKMLGRVTESEAGSSIGIFFGTNIAPEITPKISQKCRLNWMHAWSSNLGCFRLLFGPFLFVLLFCYEGKPNLTEGSARGPKTWLEKSQKWFPPHLRLSTAKRVLRA